MYALLLWAIRVRKVPTIATPEMKTLTVLGLLHAVSHITAITSLGAGAVRCGAWCVLVWWLFSTTGSADARPLSV